MSLTHDWFSATLTAEGRHIRFRRVSRGSFERVPFHDGRDDFLQNVCKTVSIEDFIAEGPGQAAVGFDRVILHQSFCGSTFLAKLLTLSGQSESYREPQILIDIASASEIPAELPAALLARFRLAPDGQTPALVKPSNWVNPYFISNGILDNARLVLVDIDLSDYLVAHLRGGKDRIRYSLNLLNHTLRFAPEWLATVKNIQSRNASDPLGATLRMLAILHIIQSNDFLTLKLQNNERILALSLGDIQSRPLDSAGAAAKWLKLDISAEDLAARYSELSGLHAKSLEPRGFNVAIEAALNDNISQKFARPLAEAQTWAEGQRKKSA